MNRPIARLDGASKINQHPALQESKFKITVIHYHQRDMDTNWNSLSYWEVANKNVLFSHTQARYNIYFVGYADSFAKMLLGGVVKRL